MNSIDIYNNSGIEGIKIWILEEKLKLYRGGSFTCNSLKFYDTIEAILDHAINHNWDADGISELDYLVYWKCVLQILLRDKDIFLKCGEPNCISSKFERQINEDEFSGAKKSVTGRKIDLLPVITLNNEKNKEVMIELGAIEIKREGIEDSMQVTQLNKNIRVNKNVLNTILLYTKLNSDKEDPFVIGLDIIGLHGFFYQIVKYEDVVFAVKLTKDDVFLPEDKDDVLDFLKSDTMDQLLFYVDNLLKISDSLKKGVKKHRRTTHNATTTSSYHWSSSPPRTTISSFPQATFYTPKKENKKKN